CVRHILGNRAIKQKVVLEHYSEMLAIVVFTKGGEGDSINKKLSGLRLVEIENKTDHCTLARTAGSDESHGRACIRVKRDTFQNGLAWVVFKPDMTEFHFATDTGNRRTCVVIIGLGMHVEHLPDTIQSRKRFRDLCSDGR